MKRRLGGRGVRVTQGKQGTSLVRDVLNYLTKVCGFPAFRQNTGAVKIGGRYVRFGPGKGALDIRGYLPAHGDYPPGRGFEVECKEGGGRLTADQKAVIDNLRSWGVLAFAVRSLEDLIEALRGEGVECP